MTVINGAGRLRRPQPDSTPHTSWPHYLHQCHATTKPCDLVQGAGPQRCKHLPRCADTSIWTACCCRHGNKQVGSVQRSAPRASEASSGATLVYQQVATRRRQQQHLNICAACTACAESAYLPEQLHVQCTLATTRVPSKQPSQHLPAHTKQGNTPPAWLPPSVHTAQPAGACTHECTCQYSKRRPELAVPAT